MPIPFITFSPFSFFVLPPPPRPAIHRQGQIIFSVFLWQWHSFIQQTLLCPPPPHRPPRCARHRLCFFYLKKNRRKKIINLTEDGKKVRWLKWHSLNSQRRKKCCVLCEELFTYFLLNKNKKWRRIGMKGKFSNIKHPILASPENHIAIFMNSKSHFVRFGCSPTSIVLNRKLTGAMLSPRYFGCYRPISKHLIQNRQWILLFLMDFPPSTVIEIVRV